MLALLSTKKPRLFAWANGLYQIEIQLGDQRQRFPWVRSDSH
jgi:hypothetical protein